MSDREQTRRLRPPDEPSAPEEAIVPDERELITGMGGGDDPIVEGVEVETDLEEEPWADDDDA
jgi:hypothetical protein